MLTNQGEYVDFNSADTFLLALTVFGLWKGAMTKTD